MINTKLDSKFENFLSETRQKIFDLSHELESLSSENSLLNQQISDHFHTNGDLQIQLKSLETQLSRFNSLHSLISSEHTLLTEKAEKAEKEFERLHSAYLSQCEIVKKEKNGLEEKEKILRVSRKAREDSFNREMERLELKKIEIFKAKQLKSELNNALVSELAYSEAIESNILTTIQSEILSLNAMTSKTFSKSIH